MATAELLDYRSLIDAAWARGDKDEYARLVRAAMRASSPRVFSEPWQPNRETPPADVPELAAKANALIERGVIYSQTIAALAHAQAILGNKREVARIIDYDRFVTVTRHVFAGEPSTFLAALTSEVKSDLDYFAETAKTKRAVHKAYRHERLFENKNLPAVQALYREIERRVAAYAAALPEDREHPFIAGRPEEYSIEGWAVVSNADGEMHAHMHPRAWIGGVYYVSRPEIAKDRARKAGWLHISPFKGMPDDCGWPSMSIEPEPGTLLLMPGYLPHYATPTHSDQERIVIAFDVVPRHLARHTI